MLLAEAQDGRGTLALGDDRRAAPRRDPHIAPHDACLATLLLDDWRCEAGLAAIGADRGEASVAATPFLVETTARIARTLGDRWVADTCSFADVTLGLHRLTLMLFAIEALPDPGRAKLHGGTVLLAPVPGDQHGFGLATVALALRRAGWDVTVALEGDADALVAAARRGFDCIGLSVGYDRAVPRVARLIERLRATTRPRRLTVAVGGPMLLREPALAKKVGADVAATDGFALAERLGSLRAAHAV